LATINGEPLVYVDEFNQRVRPAIGEGLFEARQSTLTKITDTKLVSGVARQEGFENDPFVKKIKSMAEAEAQAAGDQFTNKISDDEARRYYRKYIEEFRQPDGGTRVLFVVRSSFNEALEILTKIRKGEPFSRFSFSPDPLPGSWLPVPVQEAIFHLKPGESSEVVPTPIGFYVAKLVDRDLFDNFKVSFMVKDTLEQCQNVLKRIGAGEGFEALVAEKEYLSVAVTGLPERVQKVVPGMEIEEVSQPIATLLGFFLVKLQERWSSADIIAAKLIRVNSKAKGEKILARLKKGQGIGRVEERQVTGKDLPRELRVVARGLKEGEYSSPVKTSLGYYLVKVEERARQKYRPFDEVKEDIIKTIKAQTISGEAAGKYYDANRAKYRRPGPEYLVDIILSETLDQGEKILAELKEAPAGKKKAALFAKYQKDLGLWEVSAELLPVACKNIVRELKPGQLSPVIATHLGYFILRLSKIEDPAYLAFEDVKYEIKSLLSEQEAVQTKQRHELQIKISLTSAEENALAVVYRRASLKRVDTVSEAEAEEWWQNNKEDFMAAVGMPGQEFRLATPEKTLRFKKRNVLLRRHMAMIEDLYIENGVVIYDHLLH
jgi:parvulin-like peptidyl-prolyl isomerase